MSSRRSSPRRWNRRSSPRRLNRRSSVGVARHPLHSSLGPPMCGGRGTVVPGVSIGAAPAVLGARTPGSSSSPATMGHRTWTTAVMHRPPIGPADAQPIAERPQADGQRLIAPIRLTARHQPCRYGLEHRAWRVPSARPAAPARSRFLGSFVAAATVSRQPQQGRTAIFCGVATGGNLRKWLPPVARSHAATPLPRAVRTATITVRLPTPSFDLR